MLKRYMLLAMTYSLKRKLEIASYHEGNKRQKMEEEILRTTLVRFTGTEKLLSIKKIQKWWRYIKRYKVTNQREEVDPPKLGFVRADGKNVVCPITQDLIPNEQCFKIIVGPNAVLAYTCEDLVNYLGKTCTFECPCTRTPITLPVIRRLIRKGAKLGVMAVFSLMDRYKNRNHIKQHESELANRRLAIEVMCATLMTEILEICANFDIQTNQAAIELQNTTIPEWVGLVNHYARFDLDWCRTMLIADQEKIKRIEDDPQHNPHGLLRMVLQVVESKIQWCDEMKDTTNGRSLIFNMFDILGLGAPVEYM